MVILCVEGKKKNGYMLNDNEEKISKGFRKRISRVNTQGIHGEEAGEMMFFPRFPQVL